MATIAHHIISTYTPEDRERLELETGQRNVDVEAEAGTGVAADPWITEKPFGLSKRAGNAPKFVAASVQYDPWADQTPGAGPSRVVKERESGKDEEEGVAGWYRSLARRTQTQTPKGSTPSSSGGPSPVNAPLPPPITQPVEQARNKNSKPDKNDWFISRALISKETHSAESSGRSTPSTPTLADILSRDPPPLPSQRPFSPPVWLALGPGNKGFEMLTRSGWAEGQALGGQTRGAGRSGLGYKSRSVEEGVKREPEVVDVDAPEIVDLTISDEDEYEEESIFVKPKSSTPPSPQAEEVLPGDEEVEGETDTDTDPNRLALLTPLATVLKSDRLGIGLKAKTVPARPGAHREPVKRITHSQAALAAHIRQSEELRKMKMRHGRGRRGFERMKRKEEEKRRGMIAYLNAD